MAGRYSAADSKDDEIKHEEINLLIIGKTGNGKSKTGNTILQKKAFEVSGSMTSVTSSIEFNHAEYRDKIITVVDCKGFSDAHCDNYDNLVAFSQLMAEAMSIRDGKGYHAILIVLKYGNRLTQEERDGFDATRKIFGEDVLKKNGIIIMTCGDCYESQQKVTFQGWCRQQTGPLKDLLDDCAGRILLFDNFTEDEAKITTMRDSLLECVARLPSNGERYTNVLFKASAKEREIAIAASGTVVDRDELILDTSLLLGEFEKCKKLEENTDDAMRDEQLKAWRKLLSRCKALERLFHKKGIKSELQKQIPAFQKTLLNFIVAKDFENQDKKECYGAMIEASAQLRTAYYEGKASALQSIGKASLFLVVAGSIAALLAYGLPPVAFFVGEAMATLITKRCYGLVNFFLSFFF